MSNSNKSSNPPSGGRPANPHASAAGAYDKHARKHTPDQRELEGRVLLKAAQNFLDLQEHWDDLTNENLNSALIYNRQIWMMFVDNALEDKSDERPHSLRANITRLGAFIFKHSIDVQAQPKKEKLNILIEINREIAAGLMTQPKPDPAQTGAAASAPKS
jgi:flagellar protein FlaF